MPLANSSTDASGWSSPNEHPAPCRQGRASGIIHLVSQTPQHPQLSLPIEIRTSRQRSWGLLFGSLCFVVGCLALLLFQRPEDSLWQLAQGPRAVLLGGGALFFGFGVVLAFSRLVRNEPDAIIETTGIIDNGAESRAGLIAWSEIREIAYLPRPQVSYLKVYLHDPQAVIARMPRRMGWAARANSRAGRPLVTIVLHASDPTPDTVIGAIRALAPGLLKEQP